MSNGSVKLVGRAGCPVGELRTSVGGECYKVLAEKPVSFAFNIRDKQTGKVINTGLSSGKNILSHMLTDAKFYDAKGRDVIITVEKVIYDSKKDRPLSGGYMYRDRHTLKTGYVKR